MSTDRLKQWLALDDRRKALQKELEEVTSQRDQIAQEILDRWSEDGQQSVRLNGRTVYMRTLTVAHVLDRTKVVEVLKQEGLEGMLTPNSNTLSAWVRERLESGEGLPDSFADVITTFDRFSLATRRS